MKQVQGEVVSNIQILPGLNLMWLCAPEVAQTAQPGQFVLARCGEGLAPLLRRPLTIHRTGTNEDSLGQEGTSSKKASPKKPSHLAFLFSGVSPAMALLAQYKAGDQLDIIGPLGRGFSVRRSSHNLLLVADGWGISPMVALAQRALEKGQSVTLLMGSPTGSQIYPTDMLPKEIEVLVATEDGTMGRKGRVTDLLPEVWAWADQVFACGPVPMYRTMAAMMDQLWPSKPVQVLMAMPMACGVGVCYGCALETKRGMKLTCLDGPRFNIKDILF